MVRLFWKRRSYFRFHQMITDGTRAAKVAQSRMATHECFIELQGVSSSRSWTWSVCFFFVRSFVCPYLTPECGTSWEEEKCSTILLHRLRRKGSQPTPETPRSRARAKRARIGLTHCLMIYLLASTAAVRDLERVVLKLNVNKVGKGCLGVG